MTPGRFTCREVTYRLPVPTSTRAEVMSLTGNFSVVAFGRGPAPSAGETRALVNVDSAEQAVASHACACHSKRCPIFSGDGSTSEATLPAAAATAVPLAMSQVTAPARRAKNFAVNEPPSASLTPIDISGRCESVRNVAGPDTDGVAAKAT